MDLSDLGNIGDFLGGIGVVATLAFLVFQVRQNTIQLRQNSALISASLASSQREANDAVMTLLASNRDAVRVFWAGLESRADLEDLDCQQFDALISVSIAGHQQVFEQWQALEQSNGHGLERMDWLISKRGFQQWWDLYLDTIPIEFREFIAARMEAIPPAAQPVASADVEGPALN